MDAVQSSLRRFALVRIDVSLVGMASILLLAIAAVSSLAPARRAAQISPAAELRSK